MSKPLIEIGYKTTLESKKVYDHYHNGLEMIFIEKGQATFTINQDSKVYHENNLIFIHSFARHDMKPITFPYSRYYMIIDPALLDLALGDPVLSSIYKNRPQSLGYGLSLHHHDATVISHIFQKCCEEYMKQDAFWERTITALLTSLFIHLYRHYTTEFPLHTQNYRTTQATAIQAYIDQHFLDAITLVDIASTFHLDKYYMAHIYKEVTGYSIKQYILLKRLIFAKKLLCYSNESMTDVALSSGFNSCSNFIRTFKSHEGTTPYQYRKVFQEHNRQ